MECSSTLKRAAINNVGPNLAQSNLVPAGAAAMVDVAAVADLWRRGGFAPLSIRQAPAYVRSRVLAGGGGGKLERGGDRQDAAGVLAGRAPDRSRLQAGSGDPRLRRLLRQRAADRFLR